MPTGTYVLDSAILTYHVEYITKSISGVSKDARGKGVCASTCRFIVAAPVKSFISKDGNRDENMISTLSGARYSLVQADITLPREFAGDTLTGWFEIKLAGQAKAYADVPITITSTNGERYSVRGTIPFRLSDFGIERPALLLVRIDDLVPVDFQATWILQKP